MKIFQTSQSLADSIVKNIISDLRKSIQNHGTARMLLSGGSTPGPIYKHLDKNCEFLRNVKIGLVDERFVPFDSEFSNELLLKSCFSKLPSNRYDITGMVHDNSDEINNLREVSISYKGFVERTDVVILGMGTDGHTASIFPGDHLSKNALSSSSKALFSTRAPNHPKERITCSLNMIAKVSSIYLIISGGEKRNILENSDLSLPIHELLKRRNDVKIYFLET